MKNRNVKNKSSQQFIDRAMKRVHCFHTYEEGVTYSYEDALVISIVLANHSVHKILVDGGKGGARNFFCSGLLNKYIKKI